MRHLAIIADGNRRWAEKNGLPKQFGYTQGLVVIENFCDWAIQNSIPHLTFYCFSTENWHRKKEEVEMIIALAKKYLIEQKDWYINKSIKVNFLGRKDRLPEELIESCKQLEELTAQGHALSLNICIDYGGRNEIIEAILSGAKSEEDVTAFLTRWAPEPDLILRTGGQKRLSNFLLWQSAYSELLFLDYLFPELNYQIMDEVLSEFSQRKRSFGL